MPDLLNEDGLQVKSLSELVAEITDKMKVIYGQDINVGPESSDGQQINIYAQSGADLREVLVQINASFDIDQAFGRVLDSRVKTFYGITRNKGTFTFQNLEVASDRSVSILGLGNQADELNPSGTPYTVKDDSGNEFYLLQDTDFTGAATKTLVFRSAKIGPIQVNPNTITTVVSVIPGIVSINNPSGPSSVGKEEETDSELKIRAKSSKAISAIGNLEGLEARLRNLQGVTTAIVYENKTSVADSNGIPPHSIWCIVEGGAPLDIGEAIYAARSFGVDMKGDQTVDVPMTQGRSFEARYDLPGSEDLHIRLKIELPGQTISPDTIKQNIVSGIVWEIGESATIDEIYFFLKGENREYQISQVKVSKDGSTWEDKVDVNTLKNRFINDVSRITIL